jgi:hypothetical protein
MGKKFFFILFLLVSECICRNIYAFELFLDFRGASFDEITKKIEELKNSGIHIKRILLDHPFEESESPEFVYDYKIPESKEWMWSLITNLEKEGIEVYFYLNIFAVPRFFNRKIWQSEDFTLDSLYYLSNYYIISLESENTLRKLKNIFEVILSFSSNWVIDLRKVFDNRIYLNFLKNQANDRLIYFIDVDENTTLNSKVENFICSENYWMLRKNFFLPHRSSILNLSNYKNSGYINFIESETTSVNGVTTILFLLAKNEKVLIPYSILNGSLIKILSIIARDKFKILLYSNEKMLLQSEKGLILVNLGESFDIIKFSQNNFKPSKKICFSEIGGGFAIFGRNDVELFLFPNSISCFSDF